MTLLLDVAEQPLAASPLTIAEVVGGRQDGRAEAIVTFDDRLGREAERLGLGST